MKIRLDDVANLALTAAALIVAGATAKRLLIDRTESAGPKAAYIETWRAEAKNGKMHLHPEAPVTAVVYSDMQCPFCKKFHQVLDSLSMRYQNKLDIVYVHFPIESHSFAYPAGRAAVCAGEQGREWQMISELFKRQGEFGSQPWAQAAQAASVPDSGAFRQCMSRDEKVEALELGLASGKRIGITGTPLVLLNGWRYATVPTRVELEADIDALLSGKAPHPDMPTIGRK